MKLDIDALLANNPKTDPQKVDEYLKIRDRLRQVKGDKPSYRLTQPYAGRRVTSFGRSAAARKLAN